MASKQGYGADLKNYLEKKLQIKLNGNRNIIGILKGYDPFMNLVLDECYQILKDKEPIPLNTVMIRGNSIILWECLDKIANKS